MEMELNKNTKLSVIFDAVASGRKCTLVVEDLVETVNDYWKTVKHFKKSEFKCKCGGKYCDGFPAEIDKRVVDALEAIRKHSGKPVVVSSAVRCKTHNEVVGGSARSYHLRGRAADFSIRGITAENTIDTVHTLGLKPIELYAIDDSYVHIAF